MEINIICTNGNFYIAIGKDAVLLNPIFGLKCTCFIKYVCKVGLPVKNLSKYLNSLKTREIVYKNINEDLVVEEEFNDENLNYEK